MKMAKRNLKLEKLWLSQDLRRNISTILREYDINSLIGAYHDEDSEVDTGIVKILLNYRNQKTIQINEANYLKDLPKVDMKTILRELEQIINT